MAFGPIALTALVRYAGCSSKVPRQALAQVLAGLPEVSDPQVLVGSAAGDDAGVYELEDGRCLVQTVDVFTPVVDDPQEFGQIAAANSLSDVYAMGGRPLTALSILAYPADSLPAEAARELLVGGLAKMAEAGVPVIGGHTINGPEIMLGFAVTGLVARDRVVTKSAPREGDALILTKPLGTGIIAFAGQIGRAQPEWLQAASESMRTLNAGAARAMLEMGVHACTDVTGFGLIGHLANMLEGTGLDAEIDWRALPWLPGVLDLAGQGVLPGGIERNREAVEGRWEAEGAGAGSGMLEAIFDAQTSGGLLLAVAPDRLEALQAALLAEGCPCAARIGRISAGGSGRIRIHHVGEVTMKKQSEAKSECCAAAEPCCEHAQASAGAGEAFAAFLAAANAPGAIAAESKKLVAVALSVATRCEPCARLHVKGALEMGISEAAVNEAVWLAVVFAGSPALVWYRRLGLTQI